MMKTIKQLTIALGLLTLPSAAGAQESIRMAFDKFTQTKGVQCSISESSSQDSTDKAVTKIIDVGVGQPNFKLFDELQKAFEAERSKSLSTFTRLNPMKNTTTQKVEITRKQGGNIIVGQEEKASYITMSFPCDDPDNREVYAAEWWTTVPGEIVRGRLIYSYGERPQQRQDIGDLLKSSDDLLKKYGNLVGKDWQNLLPKESRLIGRVPSLTGTDTAEVANIPVSAGTDMDEWLTRAMNNINHLSKGDWHRFFGLVTQKIMDNYADTSMSETMVVFGGIALDLCNNATQLDADEKEVCARRLKQVATTIQSNLPYVHDLLLLAAKRVEK